MTPLMWTWWTSNFRECSSLTLNLALGALKVGLSPVFSLFSTFSELYLLSVASVGPEAWRALHEYINGDTLRERCRLLVQQAALDDGSAPLVKHSEVPLSMNRDLALLLPLYFSARILKEEPSVGRTGGSSSEASNTSAVSVRCDLVGAALALPVAFW